MPSAGASGEASGFDGTPGGNGGGTGPYGGGGGGMHGFNAGTLSNSITIIGGLTGDGSSSSERIAVYLHGNSSNKTLELQAGSTITGFVVIDGNSASAP